MAIIEVARRELGVTHVPVLDLVPLAQVDSQPLFGVVSDLTHRQTGVAVMEVARPAAKAAVHASHHIVERDTGQLPSLYKYLRPLPAMEREAKAGCPR